MGKIGGAQISAAIGRVIPVRLAGNPVRGHSYGHYTQQQDGPLRADAKQTSPHGTDASTHKRINDRPGDTKESSNTLTHTYDVISKSLREEVSCGDAAEPENG